MSLIDAMNNCRTKTHLTILDDNSETWFLDKVKELTKDISCDIISLTVQENIRQFNYSAYEQFRISSEFDSLVYVVEDDYIHEADSLNEMIAAFYYMSNRFSSDEIKIFPFDSPFLYAQYKEEPTILFYSGTRYWRTTAYTSYTFLTHSSTIKNYFEVIGLEVLDPMVKIKLDKKILVLCAKDEDYAALADEPHSYLPGRFLCTESNSA
jgi:hypothetical protein